MVLLGMLTLYINLKSHIERHSLHNKLHFHNPFQKWLNVSLMERDMASFLPCTLSGWLE